MGVGVQSEAGAVMPQHARDGLDVQSMRLPEFSCSRMACFQRENGLRIFPASDPNPGPIQGEPESMVLHCRHAFPCRRPQPTIQRPPVQVRKFSIVQTSAFWYSKSKSNRPVISGNPAYCQQGKGQK